MKFWSWLIDAIAGVQPAAYTERSLELHCESLKPQFAYRAREFMKLQSGSGEKRRRLCRDVESLLPDNLSMIGISKGEFGGVDCAVVVAVDYMSKGAEALFAICIDPEGSGIWVQRVERKTAPAAGSTAPAPGG